MREPVALQWVAIADGDDVGALLDVLASTNDESGLLRASAGIDQARESLAQWFVDRGGSILLSTADTVIAKGTGEVPNALDAPSFRPSWSVGMGRDLQSAHAALAVAKAGGKSRWVDARTWTL